MPTFKHPCPHCGKYIVRDVAICPFCGTSDPFKPRPGAPAAQPAAPQPAAPTASAPEAATDGPRKCTGCGAPLAEAARFCTVCGTLATT